MPSPIGRAHFPALCPGNRDRKTARQGLANQQKTPVPNARTYTRNPYSPQTPSSSPPQTPSPAPPAPPRQHTWAGRPDGPGSTILKARAPTAEGRLFVRVGRVGQARREEGGAQGVVVGDELLLVGGAWRHGSVWWRRGRRLWWGQGIERLIGERYAPPTNAFSSTLFAAEQV